MSWGERSCKHYGQCANNPKFETCNVDCEKYGWNGITKPDSESRDRRTPSSYSLENAVGSGRTKATGNRF